MKALAFAVVLCVSLGLASVAAAAVIEGTSGDDTLVGTPSADTIHAKAGSDMVTALRAGAIRSTVVPDHFTCRAAPAVTRSTATAVPTIWSAAQATTP